MSERLLWKQITHYELAGYEIRSWVFLSGLGNYKKVRKQFLHSLLIYFYGLHYVFHLLSILIVSSL